MPSKHAFEQSSSSVCRNLCRFNKQKPSFRPCFRRAKTAYSQSVEARGALLCTADGLAVLRRKTRETDRPESVIRRYREDRVGAAHPKARHQCAPVKRGYPLLSEFVENYLAAHKNLKRADTLKLERIHLNHCSKHFAGVRVHRITKP